jgi:hypothetical protein
MSEEGLGIQSALFFSVYIVISAFVFANIIVGIVVTNLITFQKEWKEIKQVRTLDRLLRSTRCVLMNGCVLVPQIRHRQLKEETAKKSNHDGSTLSLIGIGKKPDDESLKAKTAKVLVTASSFLGRAHSLVY